MAPFSVVFLVLVVNSVFVSSSEVPSERKHLRYDTPRFLQSTTPNQCSCYGPAPSPSRRELHDATFTLVSSGVSADNAYSVNSAWGTSPNPPPSSCCETVCKGTPPSSKLPSPTGKGGVWPTGGKGTPSPTGKGIVWPTGGKGYPAPASTGKGSSLWSPGSGGRKGTLPAPAPTGKGSSVWSSGSGGGKVSVPAPAPTGKGSSEKGGGKGGKGSGGYTDDAYCACCPNTNSTGNSTGNGTGTVLELQFVQLPPNVTVLIASGASDTAIGTTYIYNDYLLTINATILKGAFVVGYCRRLQELVGTTNTTLQEGTGYCHFTHTITDANGNEVTFNAAGEVLDRVGGTLAVTGGTGALQGVGGEVQLAPAFQDPNTEFDFFVQVQFYVGVATLLLPTSGGGGNGCAPAPTPAPTGKGSNLWASSDSGGGKGAVPAPAPTGKGSSGGSSVWSSGSSGSSGSRSYTFYSGGRRILGNLWPTGGDSSGGKGSGGSNPAPPGGKGGSNLWPAVGKGSNPSPTGGKGSNPSPTGGKGGGDLWPTGGKGGSCSVDTCNCNPTAMPTSFAPIVGVGFEPTTSPSSLPPVTPSPCTLQVGVTCYSPDGGECQLLPAIRSTDCISDLNYTYTITNIGKIPMDVTKFYRTRNGDTISLLGERSTALVPIGGSVTVAESDPVDLCKGGTWTTEVSGGAVSDLGGLPCLGQQTYSFTITPPSLTPSQSPNVAVSPTSPAPSTAGSTEIAPTTSPSAALPSNNTAPRKGESASSGSVCRGNSLETCNCNGTVTVTFNECDPQPNDWIGIYACKSPGTLTYNYAPAVWLWTCFTGPCTSRNLAFRGSLVFNDSLPSLTGNTESWPPPSGCYVTIYNRNFERNSNGSFTSMPVKATNTNVELISPRIRRLGDNGRAKYQTSCGVYNECKEPLL